MLELISNIGWPVFTNVIQLTVSSIVASIIYRLLADKYTFPMWRNIFCCVLVIAAASMTGLLLPMGTYGVIPIAIMLLAVGLRAEYVLPLVFSNAMFNMLVAFTDQNFSWKTGMWRIVFAFTAGFVAGIVFKFMNDKNESIIRLKTSSLNGSNTNIFSQTMAFFCENTNMLGFYLIVGAIANAFFQKYFLEKIINVIFMNSSFTKSLSFILVFDIANPFILSTFNLFVNFTAMAAFVRFLKLKAFSIMVITYVVLAMLFSLMAYI